MSDHEHEKDSSVVDDAAKNTSRRQFFGAAGVIGAGLALGVTGCRQESASAPTSAPSEHPKPGTLDEYYGLWSGGHTGDVRVLGMPSGREIHRIPCFVPDALVGWGITNESKADHGHQGGRQSQVLRSATRTTCTPPTRTATTTVATAG